MRTPIRVVTAGLPPLQADLVQRVLAAEPGLYVVATVLSAGALPGALRRQPADVVVLWAEGPELMTAAVDVLNQHPRLKVVMLSGDTLIEARVRDQTHDSWPRELIEAVRRAGRRDT